MSRYYGDFGLSIVGASAPQLTIRAPVLAKAAVPINVSTSVTRVAAPVKTSTPPQPTKIMQMMFAPTSVAPAVATDEPISNANVALVAGTDDEQERQLSQLQAQADAATSAAQLAESTAQGYTADDADESVMQKYGSWLWVGGAAAAVLMIVVGFAVTKKKPAPPSVSGYRRRKKRRSKR